MLKGTEVFSTAATGSFVLKLSLVRLKESKLTHGCIQEVHIH